MKAAKIALIILMAAALFGAGVLTGSRMDDGLGYSSPNQNQDYGDVTYVVGHKSPDTDTVCCAIAYAKLKQELGINCVPAVSGKINKQTELALEKAGTDTPEILENAKGKNIILVDHSEYTQSVDGMEEAHILEIIDHHGLGSVTTGDPLYVREMAVGSTATIVYTLYRDHDIEIDKQVATLIVSAILSDTDNLESSITTDLDREVLAELAETAGIDDTTAYYEELAAAMFDYSGMTNEEVFYQDYKEYEIAGKDIGVTTVTALKHKDYEELESKLTAYMNVLLPKQEMEDLYIIFHDAEKGTSKVVCAGDGAEAVLEAAFKDAVNGTYSVKKDLSRKSDVVPALTKAYTEKY